eukprot:1960494-Rhodomonas_salina.1
MLEQVSERETEETTMQSSLFWKATGCLYWPCVETVETVGTVETVCVETVWKRKAQDRRKHHDGPVPGLYRRWRNVKRAEA